MCIKLKKLMEEPHIDYGDVFLDLRIEKYNIPKIERKTLIFAVTHGGVSAFSKKKNTWVLITKDDIADIEKPTEFVLPDNWENYARWVKI